MTIITTTIIVILIITLDIIVITITIINNFMPASLHPARPTSILQSTFDVPGTLSLFDRSRHGGTEKFTSFQMRQSK